MAIPFQSEFKICCNRAFARLALAKLDYDNYFKDEVKDRIKDFVSIRKDNYLETLSKNGFSSQTIQRHLFG